MDRWVFMINAVKNKTNTPNRINDIFPALSCFNDLKVWYRERDCYQCPILLRKMQHTKQTLQKKARILLKYQLKLQTILKFKRLKVFYKFRKE